MATNRLHAVRLPLIVGTRREESPAKIHITDLVQPSTSLNRGSKRLKLGTLQPAQDVLTNLMAAQGEKRLLQQLVLKREIAGFRMKKKFAHNNTFSLRKPERTFSNIQDTSFEPQLTGKEFNDLIEVSQMPNTKAKFKLNQIVSNNSSAVKPEEVVIAEGQQVSVEFKQAKSYKLADLDEIIAAGRFQPKPKESRPGTQTKPSKLQQALTAKRPDVIHNQDPPDDSFVVTTKGSAPVLAALTAFKHDYSMRMVQTHMKEAILIMGTDFSELQIPPESEGHFLKLGTTMLRCELFPSVYFVSGIWKNLFHILKITVAKAATDKEVTMRASEFFQTLRFYCKTDKLDVNLELPTFLTFFQDIFEALQAAGFQTKIPDPSSPFNPLLKILSAGYVAFLGWALKHLDNSLSTEHSFASVDELPSLLRNQLLNGLRCDLPFEYVNLAFMLFPEPDTILTPVALDNLRNHASSLLFKHEISDLGKTGGNSSTMFWSLVIFQLMLILMRQPQTSGPIVEIWTSPTDAQFDLESIESQHQSKPEDTVVETYLGLTMNERYHGSQLNFFLDLLVRFTTSIFRDQGKYVQSYTILIDRLDKFLEAIPHLKSPAVTRSEKDLLCRLNVLIFEAMKDIKNKVLGLVVAPFIKGLVLCSIKIVERCDPKEKKMYYSLVKNGFYEIIQLFQKPKTLPPGHPDSEEMQATIIAILNFFRRNNI